MPIVVVGKNSFLANHIVGLESCRDWSFLTHQEALKSNDWIEKSDLVINFAFAPELMVDDYDPMLDIDTILAEKIEHKKSIHYIMLSTRTVYGHSICKNHILKESQIPEPFTAYGRSKLKIEQSLIDVLGNKRLTILRLANIFGYEPARHTFFGRALKTLKEEKKITLDIAHDSIRDFLAAWHFATALVKIANTPQPGLFNLGSGYGTSCHKIAEWLIEGYGEGQLVESGTSTEGQFWMDMSKSNATYNLEVISPETLHKDCLGCGLNLRRQT